MPVRPLIGITLDNQTPNQSPGVYELPATYARAVERAGGTPLLLPHTDDPALRLALSAQLDGLLIPGGDDIDPSLYGQARHPRTILMDSRRQAFDLAMLSLAQQRNLPVLGVCLGCQLINVHRGGSLHQYLPDVALKTRIAHSIPSPSTDDRRPGEPEHDVEISSNSRLAAIMGEQTLRVNSKHRQGISALGRNLLAAAFSPDGLIEAIEDPAFDLWIGVQWHPESLEGPNRERLFAALVAAAASRAARREKARGGAADTCP